MTSLKSSIKKRAVEYFLELYGDKTTEELVKTLEMAENLMKDLKYVIKFVVPCFPPNYNIF